MCLPPRLSAHSLKYFLCFEQRGKDSAHHHAVEKVLDAGHRTADIAAKGEKVLSTSEMGALILAEI